MSLPLAFAILTVLAYAFRRVWLEWLAYRPGRIQVSDFSTTNLTTVSPVELTIAFRSRLARMRLASSGAAPATLAASDFLDVLNAAQISSSNILGSLVSLLRAAVPSFAYEIEGEVVQREGTPTQYQVSLQVVRLPGEGSPPIQITDTDLDRAIRRAADAATAAILPRTRLCKGPWVAWRRYLMPGPLFNDYEEACEQEAQRRYDQARDLYYRALAQDPMNMMLRLRLGQLQEKLHSSLEALATYTAMLDVVRPAASDLPPGLYGRRAERERHRALLIARYRRSVLLGEGSFIAEWFQPFAQRHLDLERRRNALREQLEPWLRERLGDGFLLLRPNTKTEEPSPVRAQLIYEVLTYGAKREVDDLRRALPLAWRFVRRPALTRRALDLTKHCIEQRARVSGLLLPGQPRYARVRDLEDQLRRVEQWPRLRLKRPLRRWEEQYNAACLLAIPLLSNPPGAEYRTLAKLAVDRLGLAAACADSSWVARQRDWVTTDDPDLDGLRPLPPFKAFESQYFPTALATPRRPTRVQVLAEMRSSRDLLVAVARAWESVWRARALNVRAAEHVHVVRWWSDECEVWRHIHEVALNHNWRARLALTRAMSEWHLRYGVDPVDPIFERYEEDALAASDDGLDQAATQAIDRIHASLLDLTRILSSDADAHTFLSFTSGLPTVDRFDAEPDAFPPGMRRKLCAREADVWRALHQWLAPADSSDPDDLRRSFELALQRETWLWKWVRVRLLVRGARRGELRIR